jgi:hypothetical protein
VITRILAVAGWLVAGHALLGALYWFFLQIPESNAWMLASSLLVLLAAMWLAGVIQMTAVLAFAVDGPMRRALPAAVRRAWLVVLPLAVFAAAWWLTDAAASWHTRHAGQIDAAVIARTGWTRTGWLHEAAVWTLALLRWVVGTSLAAALAAALATEGLRGARPHGVRRGLRWRPLLITAAAVVLGWWGPLRAADWRPTSLPPNWVEPAFAAAKLAVLFAVAQLAWAVVLWAAARGTRSSARS